MLLTWAALLVGCGTVEPVPPPPVSCASPALVSLVPGQHAVYDPAASSGCLRLPAPGASEAEYLVALVSGQGMVTETGVSGPYNFKTEVPATAVAAPGGAAREPVPPVESRALSTPEYFHFLLRQMEQAPVTAEQRYQAPPVSAYTPPPVVGSERTFSVCKELKCTAFVSVTAVAKYVGDKVAVYLDKVVPTADPFTQQDLDELGRTFDQYHYPIDTNAFGAVSDLDGNGVVVILLTDAVNALTPDCSNGRILGFFWPGDLLQSTGSNRAEVFYGMVPAPRSVGCSASSREETLRRVKPTMIHELQHMISYNQHVLVRGAQTGELAWLNEGLSHFAEELGGRLIPDVECPGSSSCASLYITGNLRDFYDYLGDTEATFLVVPSTRGPTLEERGASWSFVRWLADHFGSDALGTNLTRALVQTAARGHENVQSVTGRAFQTLVSEWMLASYVDDLDGFTPNGDRVTYTSWGFRAVFKANCCTQDAIFDREFPIAAPVAIGSFEWSGMLRGGSGKHFRVIRPIASGDQYLLFGANSSGGGLDPALQAQVAIVRIQ